MPACTASFHHTQQLRQASWRRLLFLNPEACWTCAFPAVTVPGVYMQPALWGKQDEAGSSLVYYFALPEGWEPEQVGNPAALSLLQRFILDQHEADGNPTRSRLKLIPRISNADEWVKTGPLNGAEYRLLKVGALAPTSPGEGAFVIRCHASLLFRLGTPIMFSKSSAYVALSWLLPMMSCIRLCSRSPHISLTVGPSAL